MKKPKVILFNPPQKYYGDSLGFNVYFPLGLLMLAANVRDICDVKIYDCLIEDFEVEKGDNWTLYGTPWEKIKEYIAQEKPDIVGISVPFSAQSLQGREIAKICKEVDPNIVTILGGPHPTVRYKDLLLENASDYCIVREGEVTLREFVNEYIKNGTRNLWMIPGVATKVNDDKVKYLARMDLKDLDELPMPAYDMIDHKRYLDSPYLYKSRSSIGTASISIISSRGCPYKCTFCSITQHMGKAYRFNSVKYVLEHLRYCVNVLGINRFHFEDDNVSLDVERFDELMDAIIESELEIQWDTPNGIRADTLNKELLEKIKLSGNTSLQIAIESGNQRVLNEIIKKDSDLSDIDNVIRWCYELNIHLRAFYIIGFPRETITDMMDTVNYALNNFKNYRVFPILLFATPLYGTALYNECVAKNIIKPTITDEEISQATQFYGEPMIQTEDFSIEDLKEISRKFEDEMNSMIPKGKNFRQILKDKNSLFSHVAS